MKQLHKKIKVGTRIKLDSSEMWYLVERIICRTWVKVCGIEHEHFSCGHILKFTNK